MPRSSAPTDGGGRRLRQVAQRERKRRLRGLVLLSGGIDSAVAALIARDESADLRFLTFDYGQRNRRELAAARAIARAIDPRARHDVVRLDLRTVAESGRSALLRAPKGGGAAGEFRFYVPGRNLIFLAHAAALAESDRRDAVYVGSNLQDARRPDGSGYPDSGSEFLRLAEETVRRGLKHAASLELRGPLLDRTKFEAIRIADERGFDLALTWSCYHGGARACGSCGACQQRLLSFHWAGMVDPVPYRRPPTQALLAALRP
jgi:7-cyano-7-deazaguanine synthase